MARNPDSALGAPYTNPYVAGAGLGLVLLAAFVLTGRGLGASGAFSRSAAAAVATISPGYASARPVFKRYADGTAFWTDWLVLELIGVAAGAWASARLAGRVRREVERGPALSSGARLGAAAAGGAAMGFAAVLARGCTSGLGLTGGALLSTGSWAFLLCAFAAAYAVAPAARHLWRS